MAQICFDQTTFYYTIACALLIFGYIMYQIHIDQISKLTVQLNKVVTDADASADNRLTAAEEDEISAIEGVLDFDESIRNDDRARMHDPFVPPLRRGPMSLIGAHVTAPVNIPTRGEYGPFQQMGYLSNGNNINQAMPLMGRRIHSNQYEYYTFHHNNPNIKIPIDNPREISDGESITLPGYGSSFSANIYSLDHPRYIPY